MVMEIATLTTALEKQNDEGATSRRHENVDNVEVWQLYYNDIIKWCTAAIVCCHFRCECISYSSNSLSCSIL
jgi:hypothetical protein